MEEQLKTRTVELRKPCTTVDQALAAEYLKGEMAGIELFVTLPKTMLDEMQDTINQFNERTQSAD